jgi:hypothetical protein
MRPFKFFTNILEGLCWVLRTLPLYWGKHDRDHRALWITAV